jgi:hypothetical protein
VTEVLPEEIERSRCRLFVIVGPSCVRCLARLALPFRGRSAEGVGRKCFWVDRRDSGQLPSKEIAVAVGQRDKRTTQNGAPGWWVWEGRKLFDQRCEFNAFSPRCKALDAETDADGELAASEAHRRVQRLAPPRHYSESDNPASVARRVSEAATGRVEEQPVTRLELLGTGRSTCWQCRALFGDDPGEWLAIRNRQQVIAHVADLLKCREGTQRLSRRSHIALGGLPETRLAESLVIKALD